MSLVSNVKFWHLIKFRVLLATIKYLGGCPCPRCLITKAQIPEMGTKYDMRRRHDPSNIRVDDSWLRRKIEMTRKWIFELGYLVHGTAVEAILKPHSLVPTRVSFLLTFVYLFLQ